MENVNLANSQTNQRPLAMASVPVQQWTNETYDLPKALLVGTIFPELHMPFFMGGDTNVK